MKLVKAGFLIKEQESGLDGMYKHIEWAGRHCYKSLDKITEDSAKGFVERIIKAGHLSVLEHGTVYLAMPMEIILPIEANGWGKYTKNIYSRGFKACLVDGEKRVAVTTNLRVLVENGWLDDLKYICEPTEYHEKRYTVEFILPIGISREFCRHRVFSFSEMSTRYCNFSKDKFGNEVTFIIPDWMDTLDEGNINKYLNNGEYNISLGAASFLDSLKRSEESYLSLIERGMKPQQARDVLPLATKSELVMTGFVPDWEHFFGLRCSEAAHPQARELAIPLREEFIKRGYIKD